MKGKRHTPEQIINRLREAEAELNAGRTIGQKIGLPHVWWTRRTDIIIGCPKGAIMAKRKFTREFKVSVVKLVQEQGYSCGEAARSLGVDPNSVRGCQGIKRGRTGSIRTLIQACNRA